MARTMSTVAVGRVNRRFLFLALILASLSAVLAYTALSRSDSGEKLTPVGDISVVVAKAAIPAGTRITAEMLEVRQIPETAVGAQAVQSIEAVVGEVARYPIVANEQLLSSKVVGGSEVAGDVALRDLVEEGLRGMAIQTSAVVGAGGLVLPGDHVDVFAVPDEVVGGDHERAFLIAENVEVTAVEQTLVELPPTALGVGAEGEEPATTGDDGQRVPGAEAEPLPEAVTVTLMLTPEQAANVFCGEHLGTLRLAVRAFGDRSPSGLPVETCVIRADGQ